MKLLKKLMRIINKKDDMIEFLEGGNVRHEFDSHRIVVNDVLILRRPCQYSTERFVYCMESLYMTSFNSFYETMYIHSYIFDDTFPSELFPMGMLEYWKPKPSKIQTLARVYVNGYTVMSGHGILS